MERGVVTLDVMFASRMYILPSPFGEGSGVRLGVLFSSFILPLSNDGLPSVIHIYAFGAWSSTELSTVESVPLVVWDTGRLVVWGGDACRYSVLEVEHDGVDVVCSQAFEFEIGVEGIDVHRGVGIILLAVVPEIQHGLVTVFADAYRTVGSDEVDVVRRRHADIMIADGYIPEQWILQFCLFRFLPSHHVWRACIDRKDIAWAEVQRQCGC